MSECVCALNIQANNSCIPNEIISHIANIENTTSSKLKEKLNCTDDLCIINNANIENQLKKKIEIEYFKPLVESLSVDYWLNNTEIDTILMQLQKNYEGFAYSFIHMIDLVMFPPNNFDTLEHKISPITKINFGKEFLKKNEVHCRGNKLKSFGVVFNTDPSDRTGQHWFTIFINHNQKLDNYTIELFNSSGKDIANKKFNEFWINTSYDISKTTKKECKFFKVSNIQHQKNNTGSCGAYSLFYIYARLNGVPYEEFNNKTRIISDYEMNSFRKLLFRLA